jgi:hypothetical protein
LMKLMFLFCEQAKEKYYDFFPYKYGGYSLLVDQDKKGLIDSGLLTENENIQLNPGQSYLKQLVPYDQMVVNSLAKNVGTLRGNALIHKTYIDYPLYTCRSMILTKILNPIELEKTKARWNHDSSPCLFTLGYEGLSMDAYLGKLILNNIRTLVDVRKNPFSRKPGFSKSQLERCMKNIEVYYFHCPDLGIPSNKRQTLNTPDDYKKLFIRYESEIIPYQAESLKKIKSLLNEYKRVALTCFEADYHFCHRHKITEYLQKEQDFKIRVQHL